MYFLAGVAALVAIGTGIWLFYSPPRPDFSGERAFDYLVRQVEFGPRSPGSEGHRRTREFLIEELSQHADSVTPQDFVYTDRRDTSITYNATNIIASFNVNPSRPGRVMLSAHWDTRPIADQDPDPEMRDQPIPGANDGASGVAVLLEMARVLHEDPLDFGVDIILFDLEDLGDEGFMQDRESLNPYAIGAEHFASTQSGYRPRFGILVDMVCQENLRIPKEAYSVQNAGHIVDKVWAAARRAGADAFVDETGPAVYDDHIPFLERGIPVINIIDFDYPYWHTMEDTPDKCRPESLQQVGDVMVEVLYGR